jgi:hypothetical protein
MKKEESEGADLYDDVTEDMDPSDYVNPLFFKGN